MKPCLLWYHSFQANRFLFGTYQVAQMVMNLPAMQEIPVQSWFEEMPGDGNGSLLQYSYLDWFQFNLGSRRCLEMGMAACSSILTWIDPSSILGWEGAWRWEWQPAPVFLPGLIPVQSWVEEMPGDGNGSLLQYSYLENSTDRGAWRTTVPGVWDSVAAAREYASNGTGRNMSGSFQDLGLPRELHWEPLKFKQGFLVPVNWIWKDE